MWEHLLWTLLKPSVFLKNFAQIAYVLPFKRSKTPSSPSVYLLFIQPIQICQYTGMMSEFK